MRKFNKYMEMFWLLLAVVTAGMAAYLIITRGWDEGAVYLVFPAIAGGAYGIRRVMRQRLERFEAEQQQNNGKPFPRKKS